MYPNVVIDSLERMKRQLKKVVFKTANHEEVVFAFIDAQNIAKGIKNSGWNINWGTFRQWLAINYNVSQAYMYIGYIEKNKDLYLQLNNNGFNIDLKQMLKSGQDLRVSSEDVKGNVDVDLTIGVWREAEHYDKAIIVTGDGDFASLVQYLLKQKKLKKIIVPEFYSALYQQFDEYIVKINDYRQELIYIKGQNRALNRNLKSNLRNQTLITTPQTSRKKAVLRTQTPKPQIAKATKTTKTSNPSKTAKRTKVAKTSKAPNPAARHSTRRHIKKSLKKRMAVFNKVDK